MVFFQHVERHFKLPQVHHKRKVADAAALQAFQNAPVDRFAQAVVVGVDDQLF